MQLQSAWNTRQCICQLGPLNYRRSPSHATVRGVQSHNRRQIATVPLKRLLQRSHDQAMRKKDAGAGRGNEGKES